MGFVVCSYLLGELWVGIEGGEGEEKEGGQLGKVSVAT